MRGALCEEGLTTSTFFLGFFYPFGEFGVKVSRKVEILTTQA
ncbi:hypothetical protein D515_04398 [Grimontia indica]|uniref:Uncharacterized protein n=1 Tax=Grimontia indica TaxID=1056512 RepID=R1IPG2_9GAMM|nr:hypothetical protein D515_04398 [Grimontia indica]